MCTPPPRYMQIFWKNCICHFKLASNWPVITQTSIVCWSLSVPSNSRWTVGQLEVTGCGSFTRWVLQHLSPVGVCKGNSITGGLVMNNCMMLPAWTVWIDIVVSPCTMYVVLCYFDATFKLLMNTNQSLVVEKIEFHETQIHVSY